MTTNAEEQPADPTEPKHPNARFNVGADEVKPMLRERVEKGSITQEQSDLIWWFFVLCKENDWSLAEAGRELGYESGSTIWHLFHGTYGAKVDTIIGHIQRYRKTYEERSAYRNIQFIQTSIAKRVFEVCHAALISQSIAFIYGDPQIGKTEALLEYARQNNHGQTKYVRLPASAGVQLVAKVVAKACYVSPNTNFENLRESILDAVDGHTLVLIDEAHQSFLSYQKSSQIKVLEFLREIHDRTKCGMVFCGTKVLREELHTGKLALMLRQLERRGIIQVNLPDTPPKRDLDAIAKAFGLEPATENALEVVKDMIHRYGLGKYVKFLQAATRMAAKQQKKLTWDHFVTAHDIIARLSKGEA
jgi:DNA transposition AAA+ family ATPase